MANLTMYKVEPYKQEYFKIFSGLYNDFKNSALTDYNFELMPLDYEAFINSIEKGLLNCLILFEDNIPTGFLVYTTVISEAIELNIIHCLGNENINIKRNALLEKFIELNKHIMREKVVTYPMLGKQSAFAGEILNFGFKIINTSVLALDLTDKQQINKVNMAQTPVLPKEYTLSNWKTTYFKDVTELVHQAFKESSDALFDNRFMSYNGCRDILEKITGNIYGDFLPGITKVLLHKKRPIGVCFANLTNNSIANIPIVAVLKKYRNKGFGKILVKSTAENLITSSSEGNWNVKELNVSCDTDSIPSAEMYKFVGFSLKYTYPQAYRSKYN